MSIASLNEALQRAYALEVLGGNTLPPWGTGTDLIHWSGRPGSAPPRREIDLTQLIREHLRKRSCVRVSRALLPRGVTDSVPAANLDGRVVFEEALAWHVALTWVGLEGPPFAFIMDVERFADAVLAGEIVDST